MNPELMKEFDKAEKIAKREEKRKMRSEEGQVRLVLFGIVMIGGIVMGLVIGVKFFLEGHSHPNSEPNQPVCHEMCVTNCCGSCDCSDITG